MESFPNRAERFQEPIHRSADWNNAADSITPYPFGILQTPVRKIPRRAMAREVWGGYLVESKTTLCEYPALWKGDFLDFHAATLILTSLAASFLVGNVPCHVWSMKSTHRRGWIRFSIFTTGWTILRGSIYGDVVMLFGVRFGCCGGKVSREGRLSVTIIARRMRESRREGIECGKVGKTQWRGF